MKIVGLGNALTDILIRLQDEKLINHLGLPKGSMQLIGSSDIPAIANSIKQFPYEMVSGGSAANTIHGLASLGNICGYIGKIGNDEWGDFYETDLKNVGVQTMLYRSKTATGQAYTFITPDSERTFATYLGAAIELFEEEIHDDLFSNFDLIHFEGYLITNFRLVEKVLKLANEFGLIISLDLSSYNVVEANLPFLKKIIPQFVNIVFANEEESKAFTGMSPADSLNEIATMCDIAVVKIGKDGALIKAGNQTFNVNALPAKVLDTTGAGDQFAAGFLYGYSNNLDIEKCGKIGSVLAGKVIENYGARITSDQWSIIKEQINYIKS